MSSYDEVHCNFKTAKLNSLIFKLEQAGRLTYLPCHRKVHCGLFGWHDAYETHRCIPEDA